MIELYGFVIVNAVAYCGYVKRQIDAEAAVIDGFTPIVSYLGRLRAFAWSRISAYARRLWPEVNMVTGSAMVIGTLWLLVGAPTCSGPRTGWNYLHDPDGWLVGPVTLFGANSDWHNMLIATLYGLGLAVAGFTLVLLLVSLARRRRLGLGGVPLFLATAATALALFFLTELTYGAFLDAVPYCFMLLWLIPMWMWWRYARSKQGALRAEWPRVRKSLFHWYAPQAFIATIVSVGTLFEVHPLVGVPVFVCGLGLVALGYWNALALASPQSSR